MHHKYLIRERQREIRHTQKRRLYDHRGSDWSSIITSQRVVIAPEAGKAFLRLCELLWKTLLVE